MSILVVCAAVFGALSGGIWGAYLFKNRFQKKRRVSLRERIGSVSYLEAHHIYLSVRGLSAHVLRYCVQFSHNQRAFMFDEIIQKVFSGRMKLAKQYVVQSGLEGWITKEGLSRVRFVSTVGFALLGCLVGTCFSEVLAVLLLLIGATVGYALPVSCLKQECEERARAVETQLSPMMEVILLGLKSGLSFDRSLDFYCRYFVGSLSGSVANAYEQWSHGLSSRNDALRKLARSYDSSLFSRVTESIIRSLRFGTSLSESLSMLSVEARAIRKAKLEEQIAKAPVKMLLSVGTLILPAMLILVLGPILLELMVGW